MASLTPLAVADLPEAVAAVGAAITSAPQPENTEVVKQLRSLHETLVRVTRDATTPPVAELEAAAAIVEHVPVALTDSLTPRSRTVFRLLRGRFFGAAWEVLVDNGTGIVEEPYVASTATGAARTSPRLPLLTAIEEGVVYAQLPGFRDPRHTAPDECYDITAAVRLKLRLDEVMVGKTVTRLSGWAALDLLTTSSAERVAVILTSPSGPREIVSSAQRVRRGDLVSGRNEALTRRAWAGWSVTIDLADPLLAPGRWAAWIQIDHHGVVVRQPLARQAGDLAMVATRASWQVGTRSLQWQVTAKQWTLAVTASRPQ